MRQLQFITPGNLLGPPAVAPMGVVDGLPTGVCRFMRTAVWEDLCLKPPG